MHPLRGYFHSRYIIGVIGCSDSHAHLVVCCCYVLLLRAPLKGVMHIPVILVHNRLVDFLILIVFQYLRLVQPHRTQIVPMCPITMTFEIPLVLTVPFKHDHRALPLYIPHDCRYYILGRNRQTQMDAVYTSFPFKRPTPLYSHNRRNSGPTSCRSRPSLTFLRSFGTNTTWYLHSHTVCDNLFFICLLLSYDGHRNSGTIVGKELFYFKYYNIVFSILPGVAEGLALELKSTAVILIAGFSMLVAM